ncbi:COG3152 Predicted membrane protein [Flavobacteriaceae bacterium]
MNYYLNVLKNYTKFNGRARRSEYWYFTLFNIIITIIIGLVSGYIDLPKMSNYYTFATLCPAIAVGVRRMHDVGKSGWYLLIPFYNIILACTEGEKVENKYGVNPKVVE